MNRPRQARMILALGLLPVLGCRGDSSPARPGTGAPDTATAPVASTAAARRPPATTVGAAPSTEHSPRPPSMASPEPEVDALTEIFDEPVTAPEILSVADEPAAAYELEALRKDLTFPRSLFFPAMLVLAWAASRAVARGTRFVLRLGLKRRRLISTTGAMLSLLAWVWAFTAILSRLLRTAPTITLGVITLGAVASVFVLRRQLESLAAGVSLAVRSRLREGDRIAIGEYQGVVRRVGFTRVELHQADGSRLYLPNRLISTQAVTIGPARYSVPLQVSLDRDRPWSAEEILRARMLASLSPYRDPSGRVVVETAGDGEHHLTVQLQVWSPRLAAAAEQHLRRQLDRHVAHLPGYGADGERRQNERRNAERRGL